jgi:hypothetical protein
MSWTYSQDPTNSAKDAVRYLIGDTIQEEPLVQDEEINFNLMEVNNEYYRAAANTCISISATFARQAQQVSKTVGGLSLSQEYADRGQRYEKLAQALLERSRRVAPPIVNADPGALGAEFVMGEFDPYYTIANTWPSNSVTGVTTTYGTGYSPGSEGEADLGIEPYDGEAPGIGY